jgi:4-hydroxy-L-threonine phosphate dehydrogenase PdxA
MVRYTSFLLLVNLRTKVKSAVHLNGIILFGISLPVTSPLTHFTQPTSLRTIELITMAFITPIRASARDSPLLSQPSARPRIALTFGDPAGIGPELAVKLLADPKNQEKADIFVLADLLEVNAAALAAGVNISIVDVAGSDGVQVLDDGSAPSEAIKIREVSTQAGERALHQLKRAVKLANEGKVDAIVFTPLNKTSLHLAGMHEDDELRWFAKYLNHDGVTSEINITKGLWTSRVTSHIGIKDVAARVKAERVTESIELLSTLLYV